MRKSKEASTTYYALVRKKVLSKYPGLVGILVVLALTGMAGLAAFLVSDIAAQASSTGHDKTASESSPDRGASGGMPHVQAALPTKDANISSGTTGSNSSQSAEKIIKSPGGAAGSNSSSLRKDDLAYIQ